ncbi:MAG: hypothetical protein BJG00_002280 [Limnothrix sp. CACIAM 69d]|nr:MAG: hypothetical protein BJG00_002280 [Limnothrix sp. CACIAM 69d]
MGVDGGVWPRGMGPLNAIAQREVDFCGFPIKWGPQRVGPRRRKILQPGKYHLFPIKWGPQRVGPAKKMYRKAVDLETGFQSSGGPSEWGHVTEPKA